MKKGLEKCAGAEEYQQEDWAEKYKLHMMEQRDEQIVTGEELRRIRQAQRLTIAQVADGVCDASTLSRYETGAAKPSETMLWKILCKLGAENLMDQSAINAKLWKVGEVHQRLMDSIEFPGSVSEEAQMNLLEAMQEKAPDEGEQFLILVELINLVHSRQMTKDRPIDHQRDIWSQVMATFGSFYNTMVLFPDNKDHEWILQAMNIAEHALRIHHPDYRKGTDILGLSLSDVEMFLANIVGCLLFSDHDYISAMRVFESLIVQTKGKVKDYGSRTMRLGALEVNSALASHCARYESKAFMRMASGVERMRNAGTLERMSRGRYASMLMNLAAGRGGQAYNDYTKWSNCWTNLPEEHLHILWSNPMIFVI